ncbi:hypothetical protein D3C72_1961670 [compost metagenome]
MAQQQLHHPQISTVVEQMGSKRVPQRVGRQRHGDARHLRPFFYDDPEHGARHAAAALGHEQVVGLLAAQNGAAGLLQIAVYPLAGLFAKGHQPLLVALAHHPQHALVQAQLKGLERDQLRHTQAAGVHQLQHGAVAQAQRVAQVGRGQQCFYLGL